MPSRPTNEGVRTLTAKGLVSGRSVAIHLTQRAGGREAAGTFTIDGVEPIKKFGVLQTANGWASFTTVDSALRAIAVTVDLHDPSNNGNATLAINAGGVPLLRGSLPAAAVTITGR
jgi:hypothetical protein